MITVCPRITVAGSSGDAGKTLVSLGLLGAWRRRGLRVAAFKKGPDFIDAAWLGRASGGTCWNLDTFLMNEGAAIRSFERHTADVEIAVIEGNRGVHDGRDVHGTHSTAALAVLLRSPVILVHPVRKVTRTAAAAIIGCCTFDRNISIVGVVLNGIAGERHCRIITEALADAGGPPVLGAIPRLDDASLLPGRHLGLVTPEEHPNPEMVISRAVDVIAEYVDVDRVLSLAAAIPQQAVGHQSQASVSGWPTTCGGGRLEYPQPNPQQAVGHQTSNTGAAPLAVREMNTTGSLPQQAVGHQNRTSVRIGYFRDSAFTFYYPENLEALGEAGAKLVPLSSLEDRALPDDLDGLYIGGGFPETHAARLADNRTLRESVRCAAVRGLPIYAECGGLVYLAESLVIDETCFPLAGVFPVRVALDKKPQGHGYVRLTVDGENPYFPIGTVVNAHEFHYTHIVSGDDRARTVCALEFGKGCFRKRDGLVLNRTMATYAHLHALGVPQWAPALVRLAGQYQHERAGNIREEARGHCAVSGVG